MNFVIENNIVTHCKDPNILQAKIPDGVIAIANYAFENCQKLSEVNLPTSLKQIGEYAFSGCSSLHSVFGLENVCIIGECAFANCSALTTVTFGEKIGYLPNSAFLGCKSLEKLVLPKNILYIGCECFRDYIGIDEIEMNGVMEIDSNAFENCKEIYHLDLPESLLHIAQNAFSFCAKLKNVRISNSFVDIDEKAFENTVRLIFRSASEKSTAYDFAVANEFIFVPTIINKQCKIVTNEQFETLKKAGILAMGKKCPDSENMIMVFDKSAKDKINQLIGSDNNGI